MQNLQILQHVQIDSHHNEQAQRAVCMTNIRVVHRDFLLPSTGQQSDIYSVTCDVTITDKWFIPSDTKFTNFPDHV